MLQLTNPSSAMQTPLGVSLTSRHLFIRNTSLVDCVRERGEHRYSKCTPAGLGHTFEFLFYMGMITDIVNHPKTGKPLMLFQYFQVDLNGDYGDHIYKLWTNKKVFPFDKEVRASFISPVYLRRGKIVSSILFKKPPMSCDVKSQ